MNDSDDLIRKVAGVVNRNRSLQSDIARMQLALNNIQAMCKMLEGTKKYDVPAAIAQIKRIAGLGLGEGSWR